MKSKLFSVSFLMFSLSPSLVVIAPAQCGWVFKGGFPVAEKNTAVGFSIGTKGYIGTGRDQFGNGSQDFWEWDPAANIFTQKANFGGTARWGAAGFSVGAKGYIGLGYGATNDFWEYDPVTNIWTQKASFPGGSRSFATGFSIGSKGYLGTGSGSSGYLNDFWEWDQASNTWVQKSNFGGVGRAYATGFSIGAKGYIGTGATLAAQGSSDFWEWDQAADSWTQLPNFPGFARFQAIGFSIGSKGYIGSGKFGANSNLCNDFWEWNPATNMWMHNGNFTGPARYGAVGFSIGSKEYIATGWKTSDIWELETNKSAVSASVVVSEPYHICSGQTINVCVTGGRNYLWATGQTTNCIAVSPTATTTYSVTAWDQYGCYSTYTTNVVVDCLGYVNCNSNEGFENGNFSGWTGNSGSNTGGIGISWSGGFNQLTNNASVTSNSQHTLLTINKLDSFAIDSATNQPDVFMTTLCPTGGGYSVRLGNAKPGFGAEGLKISFTPTAQDSNFIYQFACVFQDAGHATPNEPGFMVNVYNSLNNIIPSLCDTIYGPDPYVQLLGVSSSAPDPTVLYKRWASVNLNLSAYIAQTLTIEFVNFDCGEGAHWGYTYLDVSCNTLTEIYPYGKLELLSVYPNPSHGTLSVQSPERVFKIEVLNLLGVKVYSTLVSSFTADIDLSRELNGFYFVRVHTQKGIISRKIILEK